MSSRPNQVSRLNFIPHNADLMSDGQRYVPVNSLVGPFDLHMSVMQRRLQLGNQLFGEFGKYESDARKAAVAFSYKKLMDVGLRLFDRLHNAPNRLRAKRVFCLVRLTKEAIAAGKDAEWVRNCGDLAEAYSAVDMFSFYFEVVKKTETEEEEDLSADMRDLDDIVAESFKKTEEEKGVVDHKKMREKRARDGFSFAANKNQQSSAYNSQRESCDLSMTFSTSFEFGQMIYGSVGRFFPLHHTDGQKELSELPYAPSRVFNLAAIFDRCQDEGNREECRLPMEFITMSEIHGQCIDLCKGLSFSLLTEDFRRNHFGDLAFPDIRRRTEDYFMPVPDDDTNSAVVDIDLDMSVSTYRVSSFTTAKLRLAPSLLRMNAACGVPTLSRSQKFEIRRKWQVQALVAFKSIFNDRANIAASVKKMVEEWERENEKDHGFGLPDGIPIHGIKLKHYCNLDRQSAYIANLYDFSERLGFFCHHSIFVCMLIDSWFACRKGAEKGPHCILFGGPGSGKSHIMQMVKECLQALENNMFGRQIKSMSRLAWASVDPKKPDNPETMMVQIAIFWDEVPASYLGASDMSSRRGEGDDTVAMMKEMLSAAMLGWSRNIEVMNLDGTKGRGYEEMTINNEPVFFGGMNRAPAEINPAFQRRVCFKTCVQFQRADGVTFEKAKVNETASRKDPERVQWTVALRDNAKLHLLVSTAEFCGIIHPPDLSIWDELEEKFKLEVNKYVQVSNFTDRISDGRTRCTLLTRMIAVFETYQQEDQILTFDRIISMLPEVEMRAIAGERLCLSVLSSLDDTVFPLMHRVVLHAISVKWPDLALEPASDVYQQGGESRGSYAMLPLGVNRPKHREDVVGCARRVIFNELRAIIASETQKYKLDGADALAESAPDHPVLVVKEDSTDQSITVFVSLKRLDTRDMTIDTIIKKMTKRSGGSTQLMMLPYTTGSDEVLPPLPAFCDHGFADGEIMDDAAFERRCEMLFLDPLESRAYHPASKSESADLRHYPKHFAAEIMRS